MSYWQKSVCLIRRPSRFRNIRHKRSFSYLARRCVVLRVVVLCCRSLCCVAGLSLVANQKKKCLEACLERPTDINHKFREFLAWEISTWTTKVVLQVWGQTHAQLNCYGTQHANKRYFLCYTCPRRRPLRFRKSLGCCQQKNRDLWKKKQISTTNRDISGVTVRDGIIHDDSETVPKAHTRW